MPPGVKTVRHLRGVQQAAAGRGPALHGCHVGASIAPHNDQALQDPYSIGGRRRRMLLEAVFANGSRDDLKDLAAAYLIDAVEFFRACQRLHSSSCQYRWPRLRSPTLTTVPRPGASPDDEARDIGDLLPASGKGERACRGCLDSVPR
ncbi:hypothetical protein PG996_011967 [Apiospora saccharicola]|uniref:DUF6546 domain-containing protein n=1 Tax=Apiospora saccharicola TaxID=335842 RepID=A0ABR1U192_9PEZI